MKLSNVAIILGAGNGTRMNIDKSKLLLEINGKTVIERSVDAFLDIADVDEVIVTAREQDMDIFSQLITDERVSFVIGGATRQQSVKNAVDTIDDAELIMIHDGARPLVSEEVISNTIRCAKENKAAATGVMVKDTIKVIDNDKNIVDTPERSTLVAIQTPQIFDFKLYKTALDKAQADGMDFTDDCRLVEYMGNTVKVVLGDYSNIKITTPDDVVIANQILEQRG